MLGPELAGQRHVLLAQDLLHQRLLVVRVVDDEPTVDADRLPIRPQDARAQRMERAGLDVAAAFADEADDPFPQLGGGAIRERDREDPPRCDPLDADEIGDPMGEDAGLAGSGAGEDEQRTLGRRDGPGLLGIERLDDLGGTGLPGLGDGLRVRRRDDDGRVRCRGVDGVAHPRRFLRNDRDRGLVGHVGERRPGRFVQPQRGDVGRVLASAATSGRAHPTIVEPGAWPALIQASRRRSRRPWGR